jgi:NAD(P)-dependent dehydrogenase (short-subunit alcohol dehydrogenase family)
MKPRPQAEDPAYPGSRKLQDRLAVISGGDSGIGRAVAIAFAKEGAHVAMVYLNEHEDAKETEQHVAAERRDCLLIPGDVGRPIFCQRAVAKTLARFGRLDILVNNAAKQHPQTGLEKITPKQLERTFRTNIFAYFYLTQAALKNLKRGSAIVSFTRSLSAALSEKGIRVNAVATFGSDVSMRRAGQPEEVAPSFVFLASDDSSYFTGQVLHPNGGEIVNG